VRWYNLLTDIHARKQSEEQLQRSEADLLEAQRLSHCGSWRHDLASGAFSVSPEVLRIRGVDSAAPLAHIDQMYAGIHPDDRGRVRDGYEATARSSIFTRSVILWSTTLVSCWHTSAPGSM